MECRPAICSMSLGRAAVHDLHSKIGQAAKYGFDLELFYEDLFFIARELPGGPSRDNLLVASRIVRAWCDDNRISTMCLQPFMHYEGLRDRVRHAQRIEEMTLWISMAKILGCSIIAIPSSFLPSDEASGDFELIVQDLREVADLGLSHGIQYAYEALAWGTYVSTWEQAYAIVSAVDRPNFGICFDTFNLCGRVFAEPTSPDGKTLDAETKMRTSIRRLVETVDVRKIVYVQVVDAELLSKPLGEGHPYFDQTQPARMSWSRNCRLFYGEQSLGAYLPVRDVLKAILVDLGFKGWISAELFNRSLWETSLTVPEEHAQRAAASWKKIVDDMAVDQRPYFRATTAVSLGQPARAQL